MAYIRGQEIWLGSISSHDVMLNDIVKSKFPSWVTNPSELAALLDQVTKTSPWVLLIAEYTNMTIGGAVYPHFQMAHLLTYRRGTPATYDITQQGTGSSARYFIGHSNFGTTQYRYQNITNGSYPEWGFIGSIEDYIQPLTNANDISSAQSYIMGIIDSSEGVTCPNNSDLTITDYR